MAKKSRKSRGCRELERAGALCLAFANTGVPRRDDRRKDSKAPPEVPLEHYGELVTWGQLMGILGDAAGERLRRAAAEQPEEAAAVCAGGVELRGAVVRIFTRLALGEEPRAEDLAIVNRHLRLRWAIPVEDGFRLDWIGDEDELDRPLWAIAQSAVEILTSEELESVDQCAAKGCLQLFVSRSKRRQWCDMNTCGNRVKGRRYQRYLRGIAESNRRRDAERHREYMRAKAAAEEAARAEAAPSTSQTTKSETSQPTDAEGFGRLDPSAPNRTSA